MSFEKLFLVGIIAALVIGPQRLPDYARQIGAFIRRMRGLADDARARVQQDTGVSVDPAVWKACDPRQYDPRRILRDALDPTSHGG